MKVSIGPYIEFWNVYKIVGLLKYIGWDEDSRDALSEWINSKMPFINDILIWIHEKRKRRVKIKIHPWDAYEISDSLSPIISAILIEYKKHKHSWPNNVGSNEEWDQILDKMIWSFKELQTDWEDQFYVLSERRVSFSDNREDKPNRRSNLFWYTLAGNHYKRFDFQGQVEHRKKIQEGLELFAKHFTDIWD